MHAAMTPDKLFEIIVQIAVLLFAVSFHESAHGWVALKCGDTTARDLGRITMNPIKHLDPIGSLLVPAVMAFAGGPVFGWARPVPVSLRGVRNPRRANLLVSAAGPVSNLLLAAVFAGVLFGLRIVGAGLPREIVVPLIVVAWGSVLVNFSLAIFNLLPIPPLDGFGVLESLVPARFARVTYTLRRYGLFIFLIAIFTGIFGKILAPMQELLVTWLLGRS